MHKVSGITIIIIITLLCSALCDQKKSPRIAWSTVIRASTKDVLDCSTAVSEPGLQDLLATPYTDLFIPSPSYLLASLALPRFFNEPLLLKGKEKNPSNSIPRKLYECNPFEDPARYFWLSSFYMKGNSEFESKQAHLFSTEAIEKDA